MTGRNISTIYRARFLKFRVLEILPLVEACDLFIPGSLPVVGYRPVISAPFLSRTCIWTHRNDFKEKYSRLHRHSSGIHLPQVVRKISAVILDLQIHITILIIKCFTAVISLYVIVIVISLYLLHAGFEIRVFIYRTNFLCYLSKQ